MHKHYKFYISLILCASIIISSLFNPLFVYASESSGDYDSDKWNTYDNSDITTIIVDQLTNKGVHKGDADFYEQFIRYATEYIAYGLSQVGAVISGDLYSTTDNPERLYEDLKNITDNGKINVDKTSKRMTISKSFTDVALAYFKDKNKQPENGGYELVKTVPLSQVSTFYFNTQQEFKTLVNLLNDNNGMIGFYSNYGTSMVYLKLDSNAFWIKTSTTNDYIGYDDRKSVTSYHTVRNANSGTIGYSKWVLKKNDIPALSWDDTGTDGNLTVNSYSDFYNFYGYDTFELLRNSPTEVYSSNPFKTYPFIITKSGASIPVFNTLNDAIRYMVDHNLYYTGSNYTGEGKEIVIPFDEIDKILNGYYDDMYDMLQRLIEQSGSNALTPEQLQKLVDEVQTTFGMLKQTINEGFEQQDILIQKNSQILQNTADALNAFFSQTKEFRSTFLKSFNDYTKGEKERDEMLYTLLSDYIESQKNGTGDGDSPDDGETKENFLEKIYGMVKDGFDDVVKELKKIKHWTAIDTLLDGAGAVGEWVSFLTDLLDPEKALDAVTDFVSTGADALSGVKELIDDKFPFCIPVDILVLMQTLSAEPEAPKFEIPFVLERYGIDEKVVIDLKDFGIVSDICRTFLTVLWCCSLMNFTTKITDMKGI